MSTITPPPKGCPYCGAPMTSEEPQGDGRYGEHEAEPSAEDLTRSFLQALRKGGFLGY